ncbi:hypothetical protein CSUI_009132 [Cystoisospora suis]|uniref:Transmembrane protein n=1 Tax=Cystoisospora suis TaxID=483139 RepID=A0A2C6KHM4_9APIC|nr:hypothetical protein CSUI_009132 [Cystoisospora suis]
MKDGSLPQMSALATVASFFLVLALSSAAYALENDHSILHSSSKDVEEYAGTSVADHSKKGGGSLVQQQYAGTALQGPGESKSNGPRRRKPRSSTRLSHTLSPVSSLGGLSGATVKLLVAATVFAAALLVFSRLGAMLAKCLEHMEPLNQAGSSPRLLSGSGRRNDNCELGGMPGLDRRQPLATWTTTLIAVGILLTGFVAYFVLSRLGGSFSPYAEPLLTFCFLGSVAFYAFFLYLRVQEGARRGLADPAASNMPPATLEFYLIIALLFSVAIYTGFVAPGVEWLFIAAGIGMGAIIIATNWHLNQREHRLRVRHAHGY